MSDLRNCSRDFMCSFIEIYRDNPCLWKIKSKEYSDRNKKNAAYEILVKKLQEVIPEATKDTVIKKINTIRGCFRKEYKKVKASETSGTGTENLYVPHLWYYELLLFLRDQETARSSVSNIESENEVGDKNEDDEYEDEESPRNSPLLQSLASGSTDETTQSSMPKSTTVTPDIQRTSWRKKRKEKAAGNQADDILNVVSEKLRASGNEDEFTIIGKNVATKLRRLAKETRIYSEKLINDILFEAELGNINKHTAVVTKREATPFAASMVPGPMVQTSNCSGSTTEYTNLGSNIDDATSQYYYNFASSLQPNNNC